MRFVTVDLGRLLDDWLCVPLDLPYAYMAICIYVTYEQRGLYLRVIYDAR